MPTNLGARPSTSPLSTVVGVKKRGNVTGATVAYPAADNFILPGDGSGATTGTFNRSERFWLCCGGDFISYTTPGWVTYYYKLRLLVNGSYANDLNGNQTFQKANVWGGADWFGSSIEGRYYCEANTNYEVYLLSGGANAAGSYYQSSGHWNMWAYTVGEGVY
jgi:hypothetical protein